MIDFVTLGRRALFRNGLRKILESEFGRDVSKVALEQLTDEAMAYLFRYASGPRYGDIEYVVEQLRLYLARVRMAAQTQITGGQIGWLEITRLRAAGALDDPDARPPWNR